MITLEDLNTRLYNICHISAAKPEELKAFKVNKKEGRGLQVYIQKVAIEDEEQGIARTYLIRDNVSEEIVAYFTLRTGLITVSRGAFRGFDAYTGIELANFAVNDAYREVNDVIPKLGSYIFINFIYPLVQEVSKYVGAKFLYIYALPQNKLMEHYKTMGFQMATIMMEKFVYRHVKPAYDRGCRFMYQVIQTPEK